MSLLSKPAFLGPAENLGQPHGHFGRYSAPPVCEFRKGVARHSKSGGSVCYGQAQRLDTFLQHNKAGVRRVLHGHGWFLSVDIIDVIRAAVKAENHPPV